jgi:predicted Ser/Thr protein kinase
LRTRDEEALLRLAEAVAQGTRVDWARELAAQPQLRRELEQLRVFEAMAALQADAAQDPLLERQLSHYRIPERPGRLFSPGQILGNRYQVLAFLGEGGMGEVWQACDLRLRVEVALKSVRRERLRDERALERLRREVRAAREVASPNVCRVFDLMEVDGQDLVSMEYVDGTTLAEVLRQRGPLELREASEIASQFLAGLEAIHRAGLVHRDVKPENLMLTRTGRVVLMDFGLARPEGEQKTGTVSGTPAYMAPEQGRGERLDARADLFAAGVVLAEMTDPAAFRDRPSRKAFLRGIHEDPPRLSDAPWRPVLLRAVARDPAQRPASAQALTRALEEVSLRVAGAEDLRPYPGLAAFSEADAEYFFGRELEVEQTWRRLRWPHLQAIIGPSGAGKSSFLRAGLIPALPEGWRCIACTPGRSPMLALAEALAPELSGDAEAVRELLRFEDPDAAVKIVSRWRRRCAAAVLVVDQFEELFTQNPPEAQARFADLLGRVALEADVHVLLSLRDDFLFHCHAQPALAPIFSELVPLGPPAGAALHRALVQPALKCGYHFEDEALVEEMLAELGDERGALPLLAFAAARMWEKRDRETGLLTRAVYREIGGVGGALAQHAEATLERIGAERQTLVREIFRNLVTSERTRVARDREELLSVFPDREQAEEVLRALVDARLLTSFEVREGEGGKSRRSQRVEIIHESLLVAWPRLVRWQTQDADGALLRDQLRQAAQMWEERGRAADLLWAGASYREFGVWRERYPGGLTATEEAFAKAMTARNGRQRRHRRLAFAAALALLLGVIGVVSWQEREATLQKERAEHRQAEAQREGAKTAIAR